MKTKPKTNRNSDTATPTASVTDYATTAAMDAWVRHPILGDPSFDTFEKLGDTVHVSQPPYEWAVNGSLFRDPVGGAWYYFGGLYPLGYAMGERDGKKSFYNFRIFQSADEGRSWQDLGWGFESGFRFDGHTAAANHYPDVVMTYDPDTKLYWLAYDWLNEDCSWATAHHPPEKTYDSGAAIAYATTPAGPFTRLTSPIFSNLEISRKIGRFTRAYGTSIFKRKNDWLALTLCDSGEYFSWGLLGFTAPSPRGPWSAPRILLSVDRGEYYPAPVEFFPCFAVGDTVYAPATALGRNRNYQTLHAAPLEAAHAPDAWTLTGDGNAWHARPLPHEHYGIWGQTYHGFVHAGPAGEWLTVMYPSRDERGFGTLSVAQRPWDTPHSDGFTFSGHEGKSVVPLMRAYKRFGLRARFVFTGTVEVAFDYHGVLGPDKPQACAEPSAEALTDYLAVRLSGETFALVSVRRGGAGEIVLDSGTFPRTTDAGGAGGSNVSLHLRVGDGRIAFEINGVSRELSGPAWPAGVAITGGPLALITHEYSLLTCDEFLVDGEEIPCVLRYDARDALLGAGQRSADWQAVESVGLTCVSQHAVVRSPSDSPGSPAVEMYGKWNVVGRGVTIYSPKSSRLGVMRVVVDGEYKASVDLCADADIASAPVYACELPPGRHSVAVFSEQGPIVLDVLDVRTT
ncbi:MAG: hypothetical protein FWE88_00970 [Phycisphaerae bacterium]|nr:hypothetical protein [Phycisphaerae bacterium]